MNDRRQQETVGVGSPGSSVDDRLDILLAEARLPVRPDFLPAVLRALPADARFAPRRRAAWWAPLVAVAGFVGLAALAAWATGTATESDPSSVLAVLRTLGDLAGSSLLAGAGLLVASWRGVGLLVREALGGSLLAIGALAVVVVGLNLLAWRAFLPQGAGARRSGR